ncbi:MAG: InlB B-repeat-containing protein [Christensenella sp.]|uniref:InlB B-repeat-containing protein n=1 Tax=Christensenella sp. TaxID=1935934 RepID=UPI002B1EBAEA|nr:InlB B-repeat-containing protein [Christensenella sp.]MEA5002155.1 InlB B-repeat-containing protein [Christensenella sp.]
MKQKNKILTFIMAILFVMVMMVSPAFAQEDASANVTETLQTETLQTETTGTETEEESTSSPSGEPKTTTEPTQGADPSASPSPSASAESPEESEDLLALDIMPMMLVPGADVTVTTWDDFKESVEQAEVDGKVIRIDPSLAGTMPGAITMDIAHNNSIVIDGGNQSLTAAVGAKLFAFNITGSGSITLANMTLDGTGGAGGMLSFAGSSFTLSNVTLSNVNGTAITTSNANATLDSVTVDTATNGITGSNALDITDSTFRNITTTAVTAGSGNVSVTNTTFDGVTNGTAIRGGAGSLDVTGSTLKNIIGTGIVGGAGTITVDDATFSDTNGVGISGGNNVIVKNTLFENVINNRGGHGSAIYCAGNLTVEDSSFVNSASTLDGGYIQGAIVAFGGVRTVNITRSYFKDNKASRYGGAIGFYQFAGNVNISNSYFEGNSVSGKGASSDGGAIGVFNTNAGVPSTINVDNNTFIGNTSGDDGSAYFAESRNDNTVSNLTNNTFYGNKSTKYILSVADSGGVVQLSLDTVGHFKNNTFVGNTTSSSGAHGQGSAVGQHIDSANPAVRPTATFENNIMIGNGGTNNVRRNVDIPDATDLGGNVGYDNGTALDASVTANAVFGTSPQPQANSTQHGAVGKAGSGHTGTLKTVTILPNDGATGFADNTAGSPAFSKDARGFTRDSANSDAGAMEIKFVKFDANGGEWSGLAPLTYTGSHYYADAAASTGYFLVGNPGGSVSVLTSDLPTNGTETFDGWYTDPVNGVEVTGNVSATDQTLYAHWSSDEPTTQFTITYDGNGSDSGTVPAMEVYDDGTTATVAGPGTMGKTNATFTGWNTSANGTGTPYTADQSFVINSNLDLYAQWEDNTTPISLYTLDFDSQGGSAVESIRNISAGSKVTEPSQPTRDGHTFVGWYTENTYENPWVFAERTVESDMTLYARWNPNTVPETAFTVTFDSQGGSAVDPITDIVPGSRIAAPTAPTREGYIFRGWYLESESINYWYFDHYDVNQSLTLYAKWEPVTVTTDTTTTSDSPKTGDTSMFPTVWLIVAAAAAVLVSASFKLLRRRQDD